MKIHSGLQWTAVIVFALLCVSIVAGGLEFGGQGTPPNAPERTLIVNGKSVSGAVVEMQGRTYVDLQMLSQALGGTLAIDAQRITFVIPAANVVNTPPVTQPRPASLPMESETLSVNFRAAAISALGEMRQWQGAVESVITYGIPVVGSWPQDYRDRSESSINQAKVFALADEDQNALRLLQNEFANLRDWSDTVVAERKNLNAARFVDPDALKRDTTLVKISDCARFLGGMISGGIYSDNANCH